MTGQIPDKVIYNSEIWSLVGVKGEGLHEPIEFGLTPSSPHTANWRGFVSTYKVSDMKLFLNDMEVCIKDIDHNYPEINGIKPESRNEGKIILNYKNIGLETNFSGSMLISKDFIDSMYVHMGFQSPISYEMVIELEFNEGKLVSEKDLSRKMKEYRKKGRSDGKLDRSHDIMKWIERTFSLDYDF